MTKQSILIAIMATLCTSFAFAGDVVAPQGSVRSVSVDDFMPHQSNVKEFNETWSYQFVFDNGTRAFINYSTLHIPGAGKKVTCDMSFWNFKSKTYTVGRQYPPERLKANKATASIDINGEYAMEHKPGKDHRVLFSADKGGKFLVDVTFETAEVGKVPGNGVWKIGKETFGQYVHIPYGRVKGKIAYNEDTIAVKGYAYMDQTWQTEQATDMAARSVNFSTSARSPLFAGRVSISKSGEPFGYALYKDESGMKVASPKAIKDGSDNYNGKKFAKSDLTFEWQDASIPALKFSVAKTLQKASLLDKVDGWFAKKAFKIAAGGEVLFYRGRSDASHGKKLDWCITGVKD